jgi:hypothetical protein
MPGIIPRSSIEYTAWRPIFNRCAISSTDMRMLAEFADSSAFDCTFLDIRLPDFFHVNPYCPCHGNGYCAGPGRIASFANNTVDLHPRPKASLRVDAQTIRGRSCRVQQLNGVLENLAWLKPPIRYPFAMALHETVGSRNPLHHTLGNKLCQRF